MIPIPLRPTRVALGVLSAIGLTQPALAGDLILVDPDGDGQDPITVNVFDWSVGNALAVDVLPVPALGAVEFSTFAHGFLGNFLAAGNTPILNTGLNTTFEYTFVFGVRESAVQDTPNTVVFSLVPESPNFFEIYYDPARNSDMLEGTGFADGVRILTGEIVSLGGNFTRILQNVLFDQSGADNYGGQRSVGGAGGNQIVVRVTSFDPVFFIDSVPDTLTLDFTTQQVLPFSQTNPSRRFVGGPLEAGHPVVIPSLGTINGSSGPDFQFQTDPNQSFRVEVLPARLGDFVWNDLNENGIQDPGEPGIDGVKVTLFDANTLQMVAMTLTASGGQYLFDNLDPGDYIV
ncbi:MAG: hypothetical protein M3Z21_09235 [Pseudomonadota bacterium]|nr:hypothetical protein [Pseudomonadota bacterium]